MGDTKQTKTIGEHYAAAELARRGWAPAFTRDGLERTDILAVQPGENRRMIEVQVKTALGPAWKWMNWPLGDKAQRPSESQAEFFVMVAALSELKTPPRFFVLPRGHVAAAAWISHQHWLTEPGVPSGKRNASANHSRVNISTFTGYEDRWDLLLEDENQWPVLLPPEYRKYALEPRVGLPPDHPWRSQLPEW